jgi:hypothetical protein
MVNSVVIFQDFQENLNSLFVSEYYLDNIRTKKQKEKLLLGSKIKAVTLFFVSDRNQPCTRSYDRRPSHSTVVVYTTWPTVTEVYMFLFSLFNISIACFRVLQAQ